MPFRCWGVPGLLSPGPPAPDLPQDDLQNLTDQILYYACDKHAAQFAIFSGRSVPVPLM